MKQLIPQAFLTYGYYLKDFLLAVFSSIEDFANINSEMSVLKLKIEAFCSVMIACKIKN